MINTQLSKKIENCNKDFVEENLVVYLKEILETNNDISIKYKDEKLTESQFVEAYQEIMARNETFDIREPKPTHHLLIPFAIDILPITEQKREQAIILEFMEEYLEFSNTIDSGDKNDKLLFYRNLFSKIKKKSMTISPDSQHNKENF